nr:MAG TPA: hypothetical protein [Caudoviricetes sp.]
MNMLDWARKEVEIACRKENPDKKRGEFDYGCACYGSALKAFESLCGDGHSGFSIKMTQSILNRLIDGKPLTPIEDTDDIWDTCTWHDSDGFKWYQCKRMPSLFKKVYPDGAIKYRDNDRSYCVDINDPRIIYTSGLGSCVVDAMFPITMPYMPSKPIKVYCEDFLTDKKNGDSDTVGVFYAIKTENGQPEKIEINRFFRKPEGNEDGKWTEISKEEYDERKSRKL